MRLVSVKRETHHHRGYRIEGVKQGEGMLLSVFPTRPNLPTLKYSRFRTLRGSWTKAVGVVTGYIDEALKDTRHDIPPKKVPYQSPSTSERLADKVINTPRLHGVNRPAALGTSKPC
jgi:hypothetical protein